MRTASWKSLSGYRTITGGVSDPFDNIALGAFPAARRSEGSDERSAAVLNDATVPQLKRLRHYFSDLGKIYGQKAAIPGCMMGRFGLEIAEVSPLLRKQISATFDHWQHTIATVIREAVAQKELPPGTDAESLAGFLLNSWEGPLLRSQAEKNDAPLETFQRYALDAPPKKPNPKTHRKRL